MRADGAQVDARKKFLWLNVCVAIRGVQGQEAHYVFRPQVHSRPVSAPRPATYINEYAKAKFGTEPKNISRDHPRGRPLRRRRRGGQRGEVQEARHEHRAEGRLLGDRARSLRAGDQAAPRAPDVLLHTGYNPDITLFLRQAKEQGLKFKALIGHGAGHSQIDKLRRDLRRRRQLLPHRRSGRRRSCSIRRRSSPASAS